MGRVARSCRPPAGSPSGSIAARSWRSSAKAARASRPSRGCSPVRSDPRQGEILLDGAAVQPWKRGAFRAYKSDVQMIFQDPFASLNAVHTVRYALSRPVHLHQHLKGKEAIAAEVGRLLERVRLTPTEQFLAQVPARAVRRPAPARRDRTRARRAAAGAAGRRAGLDARRLDPPRGARPARRAALPVRARGPVCHARHRLGTLFRRRHARDVRRRDRRARTVRGRHATDRRTPTRSCWSPPRPTPTSSAAGSSPRPRVRRGARGARCRASVGCRFAPRCPSRRRLAAAPSHRRCCGSTRSEPRPAGGSMSPHQTCSSKHQVEREETMRPDRRD